jgi:glycosyltransferase involved in cell wall biosynthesis
MHLSIVSGTYNRIQLLKAMIDSARAQLPAGVLHEFVIVDGGSDDGTQEWCKSQPDIRLIEQGELLGAVKAFDAGAFAARGHYVVLANDDILFRGDGLVRAMVYLEDTPTCGAVAFADNRLNKDIFRTSPVPAITVDGRSTSVPYAQVGMFRRWLGNHVGWWGLHGTFKAKTYAADNAISAAIWETGYSVDAVPGCEIEDLIYNDELRNINTLNPTGGEHPDSAAYYARWPRGPQLKAKPAIEAPHGNKREIGLRTLYLPIYEAGNNTPQVKQREQKRGLRDALNRYGMVYEFDYLTYQHRTVVLKAALVAILEQFKPDVILAQVHAPDVLTPEILRDIRAMCPRTVFINWNGDYWPEAQTSVKMLEYLRHVDLALVVNADILPVYEQYNIPAAYWQIGFENPPGIAPDVRAHDIVFLGQNYNQERRAFGDVLLSLRADGVDVGIYGNYWKEGESYPDCTYDFLQGAALYQNAKLTVANNPFPESLGFVSNRIFQALAAGGALMLHQYVRGLEDLTGLKPNTHYVEWRTFEEFKAKVLYYLDPANEAERKRIADAGHKFVTEYHSFDARLEHLFTGGRQGESPLIALSKQRPRRNVAIQYQGRRADPFGLKGMHTNIQYECFPNRPLVMDTLDWDRLKILEPELWREIGTAHGDPVAEGIR